MDRLLNEWRRAAASATGRIAQPRIATVASVDADNHSVRVNIQPEGVLSGWLPVGAVSVGQGVGIVAPPSVGDQVLIIPQEGDDQHWVVAARIWSTRSRPPVSEATEKAVQPGEVGIFTDGAWLHVSGGVIHAQATELRFKGKLKVDGDIESTGEVRAEGDVKAASVSLKDHRHPGIRRGGELTDPPQQ